MHFEMRLRPDVPVGEFFHQCDQLLLPPVCSLSSCRPFKLLARARKQLLPLCLGSSLRSDRIFESQLQEF
jgi:hypothetical protein